MPDSSPIIVWFRRDLRLADNPALLAAVESRRPIVPVYIHAPEEEAPWQPGGAARWWLHHSLESLARRLDTFGARLVIRTGPSLEALRELLRETDARAVHFNRLYEPACRVRDERVAEKLEADGVQVRSFNAALLHEPWTIRTKSGDPYRVFTPFWRACQSEFAPAQPQGAPRRIATPAAWPRSEPIGRLGLLPAVDWAAGLRAQWTPGEEGARRQLRRFLDGALTSYHDGRNRPDREGTSRLSPHLHWGEIGPRQVYHAVAERVRGRAAQAYLAELGWREFAHHLLHHFPHTAEKPLYEKFAAFPWRRSKKDLAAWQRGRTGYPIVDAGMRELWRTGWMHNRVRMIVASFLVKDLRLPWQEGARWFWDTLVDADLASNTLNWQWAAGCGADAAPYFRIFNPVLQGRKFDPAGEYVRRHVTELRDHSARTIHSPWESGDGARGYPPPMVDHKQAREEALAAYEAVRRG